MRSKSFSRLKHIRKTFPVNRTMSANVTRMDRELTWGHGWTVRCVSRHCTKEAAPWLGGRGILVALTRVSVYLRCGFRLALSLAAVKSVRWNTKSVELARSARRLPLGTSR